MKTLRPFLLIVLITVAFVSCKPAGNQTLTLYSEPSLDGMVEWVAGGAPNTYFSRSNISPEMIGGNFAADDPGVARIVVSFNLATLPADAEIVSATLRMHQDSASTGDSYTNLGDVLVTNVSYAAVTASDALWEQAGTGSDIAIGPLATSFAANTWHEIDVTISAEDELANYHNGRLQFRIFHNLENSGAEDTDSWTMGESVSNRPELVIVYK